MLRRPILLIVFLAAMSSLCVSLARAQTVAPGQHVKLAGSNEQGVPLHREPRPSMVGRIPDGTVATVIDTAREGRWLRVTTTADLSGWIVPRYIEAVVSGPVPPTAAPAAADRADEDETRVWESASSCEDIVHTGRRMATARGDVLRIATWNIRWFPDGDLNGTPESRTDLPWLACALAWMNADVVALQEIRTTPTAAQAWEAVTDGLSALTGNDWKVGFQECGSPMRQHTGFLWNASRVELSDPRDLWKLNGAAEGPEAPCASGLRPGHYRMVRAKGGGADFHFVSVHLDSGTTPRDRANRDTAIGRIAEALAPVLPDNSDAIVLGDFNMMGDGTPDAAAAEIRALGTAVVNQPAAFEHVAVEPACTEYFDGHAGWLDHVVVARAMTEASQRTARVTGYCALTNCARLPRPPAAAERLSDHCPVVYEVDNRDLD
ncbi:endonuclease/exonuclease/phosphatase family protein [Azospirillum melinis]|uniref:endonuclease/exonuclease/phosphatase family protein n=1 Tax=Azospirillum melinis TaxID=328839 RepID=UPI0037577E7F